jgi:starch phosphorylase
VPITHITNGVHFRSWISQEMVQLYNRYLGPSWRDHPVDQSVWRRVQSIPAEELWNTHKRRRERLVAFARQRLRLQLQNRGASQAEIEAADEVLDPEILTIGFARRFATYKRATLLIRNKQRLEKILNDTQRPVQIIFAGKAHPRDDQGKELIRQIVSLAIEPQFRRRMVFLENYDVTIARYLVQGVDVWLNTPLRPNEASGTSGMKVLANGGLNLSTLDGWWDEAYRSSDGDGVMVGWPIGRGESYSDREYQDQVEAEALYDILERDVVPCFYERRADGLPRRWINLMKSSIGSLCHCFNTNRMVREYAEMFYLVAHANQKLLASDEANRARSLAASIVRIQKAWSQIRIELADPNLSAEIPVGQNVRFHARVQVGRLSGADIRVQLYTGRLNADGEIMGAVITEMELAGKEADGRLLYEASISPSGSGLHGYTARVLPKHSDLRNPYIPGLITWAG